MSNIKDNTIKENINTSDHYRKIILNNIKHDLTNPINAILGYSELMMEVAQDEKNHALEKDAHAIHDSGTTILEHINVIFSTEPSNSDNAIGEIIYNTELQYTVRTPLSTIIGLSELAIDDATAKSDKNLQDILESMEKIMLAGKRLFKLITNLKSYADLNVEEFMEKYNPDIYSKDASLRLFDFNAKVKIQEQTGTILIVDDEVSNLELLEKILLQSNHIVF